MTVIPYTNNAFQTITNNSIQQHNYSHQNNEFIQSLISDIDIFITDCLYDYDATQKIMNHVGLLIQKYRTYLDKSMIRQYIAPLDSKYAHVFGNCFLQSLFAQYLYDNVMINEQQNENIIGIHI